MVQCTARHLSCLTVLWAKHDCMICEIAVYLGITVVVLRQVTLAY